MKNFAIHWFAENKIKANHSTVLQKQYAGLLSESGGGSIQGPEGKDFHLFNVEKTRSRLSFTMQAEGENETKQYCFESKVEGAWVGGEKSLNHQDRFPCYLNEIV